MTSSRGNITEFYVCALVGVLIKCKQVCMCKGEKQHYSVYTTFMKRVGSR